MTETFGPPREVLSSIYEISPTTLEEIALWLEQRGMRVQVSQLLGVSASFLTQQVVGARVFHSADQSITNNTVTALAFDSERFDTDTIHDTSTNNSRLTCKTAGKYAISVTVEWPANAAGQRQIILRLNGATQIGRDTEQTNSGTYPTSHSAYALYDLAAADYVEAVVYQDSGGALNVTAAGNVSPEFMMHRVGR